MTTVTTATAANTTAPIAETSSKKKVVELVTKACKSYQSSQALTQDAALAVLVHAQAYGDCDQAKVLARGVPARERNSLIGWFSMFSPIGVAIGKTATADQVRFIRKDSKNYNDFNVEGAKAHMWFDDPAQVNGEPKPLNTIIDFYTIIDRMLKKAISDAEKEDNAARYDPEQRDVVKAQANDILTMVNKYRAKHLADAFKNKEDLKAADAVLNVEPVAQAA